MTAITFDAVVEATGGSTTGIPVPPDVLAALGGGRRPAVRVRIGGHEARTTIGTMGGRQLIPVSAALRAAFGVAAGDAVTVELALDDAPRDVEVPDALAAALAASPAAAAFHAGLAPSIRRYWADQVAGARTDETRQRRVEKAIGLFEAGKAR